MMDNIYKSTREMPGPVSAGAMVCTLPGTLLPCAGNMVIVKVLVVVVMVMVVRVITYLIFVIFFTQARFLENKIYTEERVNYDKWILRQNSVNRDLLGQANYKDQDYTKFVTHCV